MSDSGDGQLPNSGNPPRMLRAAFTLLDVSGPGHKRHYDAAFSEVRSTAASRRNNP
jgi:hypothetical protein